MNIDIKETSGYFDLLKKDVKIFSSRDDQAFGLRVSSLQSALIDALAGLGYADGHDFRVGWDWDTSYLIYGSIIDKNMIGRSLIQAVLKVFSEDDEPGGWVCLFHVEKTGSIVGSQFYIKANGDIVIEKDIEWHEIESRIREGDGK